jgi:FkbM family methyltransferase
LVLDLNRSLIVFKAERIALRTVFDRIVNNICRRIKAKKFGIIFDRCAHFKLPSSLNIAGKKVAIYSPDVGEVLFIFVEIFLDDCYQLESLSQEKIATVIDIGANIGFSALAARHFFPDAVIHAYEPNFYLEKYLRFQSQAGKFDYFMEAIGLEDGFANLEISKSIIAVQTKTSKSGTIPQIAFRTAIERIGGSVDLVKSDCEGAEWLFLEDATSWRKVKNITMEYHLWSGGRTLKDIKHKIQTLGFRIRTLRESSNDVGLILASR